MANDAANNPSSDQRSENDMPYMDFVRGLLAQLQQPHIVELGSRQVTEENLVQMLELPKGSYKYTGFDIHPGPNVDLTGDAHELSRHLAPGSVDVIISKSVFEHIAMPWKVVLEMNEVLRRGGLVFINTLFTFPLHELPWDFWRFTEEAWPVLFNKHTGFEILRTSLDTKCWITPEAPIPIYRQEYWFGFANSNVLARKVADYDHDRLRWDLAAEDVLHTIYPPGKGG